MNMKSKRLLSVLLSVAMVLSLLVVPAAAVASAGTTWQFDRAEDAKKKSDPETSYTSWEAMESDQFENMTLSNIKYHSVGVGLAMGSGTISIDVDGDCDIEVAVNNAWNVQLGDDAATAKVMGTDASPLVFHYTGGAGTAVLKANGQTYVNSITLKAATVAPPELALGAKKVVMKEGSEATTVTATVGHATKGAVMATPVDAGVVTVDTTSGDIVLTPVAPGTTTVNVSVAISNTEDGSAGPLTGAIAVRVLPAEVGTVSEKTYTFRSSEDDYYAAGLEWETGKWNWDAGNGHGPAGQGNLTVHLPEGKKATLTAETCGFGAGSAYTLTVGGEEQTGTENATAENGYKGWTFTVEDVQGDVILTFGGGGGYVHSLKVEFAAEPTPTPTPDVDPTPTPTPGVDPTPTPGAGTTDPTPTPTPAVTPTSNPQPAETPTQWLLKSGTDWTAEEKQDIQKKTGTLRGLEIDATNGKFGGGRLGSDWIQFNAGTIIKVPVQVPAGKKALVTVAVYDVNTISVDNVPNTEKTQQFVCAGTDGWVVIEGLGGQGYLDSIKVEYGEGELVPVLEVSKSYLGLELGKKESGEIEVTVANSTAAIKAVPADASIVTAAVDGKKVTITAKAEGSTTVDISLDGVAESELTKKTVKVDVDPAGASDTATVEAKTYSFDTSGVTAETIEAIRGLSVSDDFVYGNSHGIQNVVGSTVTLKLARKANITVVGCTYGTGKNLEIESTSGTVTKELGAWNNGETDVPKIIIAEAEGETVLTLKGTSTWIHSIDVTYLAEEVPMAERRIQVWDFGGKVEANTDLYTNHITPETLKNAKMANGNPAIEAGIIKVAQNTSDGTEFGDVVFAAGNNDKFFSNVAELAALAGSNAGDTHAHDFGDGYVSAGGFITNGGGNANRRNVTVKAVRAGEVVTAYLSNNQSDTTFEVEGFADIPPVKVVSKDFGVLSFVAPKTGNYKIWANGGKPGFLRVTVTPTVTVTGKVTAPAEFTSDTWGLKFIDTETQRLTEAKVDRSTGTYAVELAPGRTYNVSLVNARGWGISPATRSVAPVNTEITTGKGHDMEIVVRPLYTYTGTITGFAEGYDLSKLVVTMVPDEQSVTSMGAEPIDLSVTGNSFTADLDPSVKYTVALKGVNDYQVKSPAEVTSEGADLTGQKIEVEPKAVLAASGKFVELDVDDQFAPLYADSTYKALSGTVTALEFENVEDGYVYPATVKDGGYTVSLRAGSYLAKATAEGFSTQTHVVVSDKAVSRDLLFVSTAEAAKVDYAADVYVGDAAKTPNFKTVTGALAYIARMERTDAQRVTVHIAPGTYREQLDISVKNVTFVNDSPNQEVLLTWYYGIGYTYYSAKFVSPTECWYDPQLAFDRYAKADADVSRWGATVRVRAPGFRAENITFENSFNYYVTAEEVYDGVVPNGKESITFARDPGVDVKTKAATERAAAIWVDTNNGRGDMTEFKSCKFLSSQDTFGTGKRMYMKDCYIEGMTDFICGPGDCVFDTCVLNWKGYSEKETAGYLTAPQTAAAEKGYLFRNCFVSGDTKLMLVGGALGRTWGAADTKCLYYNTTLQSEDMIVDPTWVEMQGFNPANSKTLLEWGTQLMDGTKVDLSKRKLQNTVLTSEPTVDVKSYFGDWTPVYYVEEAATVAFEKDPYITDNGDINIPYPGHTLTVNYSLGAANDANDASVIKWYAVKDGKDTLVKSSFANADKTYKIDKADIGANIKVEVIPTTLSGKTGTAKTATVVETVKDGYDDPTGATDPELGEGVNIFLAGDSTVKHYGAVGMHQNGKIGKEGSWGEFFQAFFNEKVTVVNYANGGRSTRNFINEGSLDKIAKKLGEGDYLFIQFGHNDCADGASYIDDRYVPLGTPDANGIYPVTPGTKGADGKYTWDCGGTYKWFLQQYIDAAKNAGATPVLMTPVARMYYDANGAIRPHHDDSKTQNNAYCEAVRQLAQEQNVLLIDGYELTKQMYEDAYKAAGNDTYGQQVMAEGDKTHSNKLGGIIEAALLAQAVRNMDLNISKAVQAPGAMTGKNEADAVVFTVDSQGVFTAYDMLKGYAETAPYWMGVGQDLLDALKTAKPDDPTKPDTAVLTAAIAEAKKAVDGIYVVADDVTASQVTKGTKFITETDKAALDAAIKAAEAAVAKADVTEAELAKAKADLDQAMKAIQTGSKSSGTTPSGRPSGSSSAAARPTETVVKDANGNTAKKTVNSAGDVVITVTDKNGEVLAEINLPASIAAPSNKFKDVPDNHWAAKSINNMAALGMVKGVAEDTYDMTSPMTRGAIATVLFRLANGKGGKTSNFADVDADAWYTDAVGWAAATGVVNGYSETTFGPEDSITRQQLAVMITRLMKLAGVDTTATIDKLSAFVDGADTDAWAQESVAWCVANGIIKGKGNDILDPTAAVTRAEAAAMLDRALATLR